MASLLSLLMPTATAASGLDVGLDDPLGGAIPIGYESGRVPISAVEAGVEMPQGVRVPRGGRDPETCRKTYRRKSTRVPTWPEFVDMMAALASPSNVEAFVRDTIDPSSPQGAAYYARYKAWTDPEGVQLLVRTRYDSYKRPRRRFDTAARRRDAAKTLRAMATHQAIWRKAARAVAKMSGREFGRALPKRGGHKRGCRCATCR